MDLFSSSLLIQVFSFCRRQDLRNIALVSKQWSDIFHEEAYWYAAFIKEFGNEPFGPSIPDGKWMMEFFERKHLLEPWKCKRRKAKTIRNSGDNSKILHATIDVESNAIRLITETSFTTLFYDNTVQKSQKKEKHRLKCNNQRTTFTELLQTDERSSCADLCGGKLIIATYDTGRVYMIRGDFPRIRRQIHDILPPSDLRNARLRNKWSCIDLWCHQEFLLVVQRDRDTRFTLIDSSKVRIQEVVPEVITWCMTRSGHVWYSLPNGSIYCLQDKRTLLCQRQISNMFPVILEHGKEGLILIDCKNSILLDCASLKELARVAMPDERLVHVFYRRHDIDNRIIAASFQRNDGSGVLYRLAVCKNLLFFDEIIESRTESTYSAAFVSRVVIVALSKSSLFLFDALNLHKLDVINIPGRVRVEASSVAFLDCVEDGGARLLMSIGRGVLLLWFFEIPQEPNALPTSVKTNKPKNAQNNLVPPASSSKRHISVENSPEMEAREGLEGYYTDLEDEQALDRIRSRVNPEGLNEDELLQLAIQASLADASTDVEEAMQHHLFI